MPLSDIPQSSVGAPLPCIVATEHSLAVAFPLQERDPSWDGSSIRIVSHDSDEELIGVIRFNRAIAHFFGPPNDEAFRVHPLADRGLEPYGAFEITSSSWIHALEKMNSVHPCHMREHFKVYRHFVLSFHDTTFECVATGYTCEVHRGNLQQIMAGLC
ncbi:hypothetical protein ACO0KY_19555 [Undibacterium sp. Dicai25W]|uniref:hypothetical protein n=1 Tax=Undibacterium sp. Dicai25W TaxID=3413034 RepID=UPI003BF0AAD0